LMRRCAGVSVLAALGDIAWSDAWLGNVATPPDL